MSGRSACLSSGRSFLSILSAARDRPNRLHAPDRLDSRPQCEMVPTDPGLRSSWGFLTGKNPHAPRNRYQAMAVQAGHFKIELIPGEFRVMSHQGLKVTFTGTSEKFEDSLSDEILPRHLASPSDNKRTPRQATLPEQILQEVSEKSRPAP